MPKYLLLAKFQTYYYQFFLTTINIQSDFCLTLCKSKNPIYYEKNDVNDQCFDTDRIFQL